MEPPKQRFVIFGDVDAINESLVFFMKDHGSEFRVPPATLVEPPGHDHSFERCSQTPSFLFVSLKLSLVGFGKDWYDSVGLLDLVPHPGEPSLIGVLHVLINPGLNPVGSESVGQGTHALFVLGPSRGCN